MSYSINERLNEFQKVLKNTKFSNKVKGDHLLEDGLIDIYKMLILKRTDKKCLHIVGNGGSSAIASHAANDFINVGQINAYTISDPAIITCLANDYGYENVFSRRLKLSASDGDVLIAISSSGESENIINAVNIAKESNMEVVTFSGFSENNRLRLLGDSNFWCDSSDYGIVEISHQFLLHNLSDRIGNI
jgi:D-sedoheptulose 7-phosphate isomerase